MENVLDYQPATPESVWAALRETDRILKENARQMKESHAEYEQWKKKLDAKYEQKREKSNAEYERWRKESNADYDRRIKKLEELTGSWAYNHGSFAEEYFFNSFENGKQNFFGEKFDKVKKKLTNFWQGIEDEYDIVLYNHSAVALIEVKYKAHENDIPKVLKKAETFRILFPNYKDFKIYLGLASLSFYPELEQECIQEGIAIIKQVGDTVIINDAHLKTF